MRFMMLMIPKEYTSGRVGMWNRPELPRICRNSRKASRAWRCPRAVELARD
jgi:hypothetical protein